jgi:hypothetical protein
MKRRRDVGKVPMPEMAVAQCAPSPPVDHNEIVRRIAKLEGMLALLYDTWFEGCDVVRTTIGAEISKLRLGVRW